MEKTKLAQYLASEGKSTRGKLLQGRVYFIMRKNLCELEPAKRKGWSMEQPRTVTLQKEATATDREAGARVKRSG